jgi:DMSO/TMAO reductase YedYZ molybdopterin-dependent catalytic subunit
MALRDKPPGARLAAGLDAASIVKDAEKELKAPLRRLFGKRMLSLGGLVLLSGCEMKDGPSVEKMLRKVSELNDVAQAAIFNPNAMADTFPDSMITRPFPFNAFYDIDNLPEIDVANYKLEVGGMATGKKTWTLEELRALPQVSQITRHICIEGWSAIGKWQGVLFSDFLKLAGADTTARYVSFQCADDYSTSIDMPTALHPQTQLTLDYDGETLPLKYGFPMKLRMPTKLGYKNPKHIAAITITNTYTGGYWENQGYNWFGGS